MRLSLVERKFHRSTAARCFNEAWDYLVKKHRTPRDDRRMLDLVHASHYHWGLVGSPREMTIADWQVSRVYAALHEAPLALLFARSSAELCATHGLSDLQCTASEAMARALAVGEDFASARVYLKRARDFLDASKVEDAERKVYRGQIRETARMIRRKGRPGVRAMGGAPSARRGRLQPP